MPAIEIQALVHCEFPKKEWFKSSKVFPLSHHFGLVRSLSRINEGFKLLTILTYKDFNVTLK